MNKFGMLAVVLTLVGCSSFRSTDDLPVVKDFDASRYMGVWYEIARLPQWFERDLDEVTATYSFEGGKLRVVNRGVRDGKEVVATAVGRFAGPSDEGAFRISFFRPFYGDYRIVWLSPEYDLALVTSSDRSSLWLLSRDKALDASRRDELIDLARGWGFDTERLEYPAIRW